MPEVGETLKSEREARAMTIEQIALETGIQSLYLEAMERNELDALPGRAFGKLYIRAYARVLGFDPQPLIDDYDRELQRDRAVSTQASGTGSDRPRPIGSMIATWRQARIAERSKPMDDSGGLLESGSGDEADADASAMVDDADVSAMVDDADEPPFADASVASGNGVAADEDVDRTRENATDEQDRVAAVERAVDSRLQAAPDHDAWPVHDEAPAARDESADPVAEALVPSASPVSESTSTARIPSRTPALAMLLALGLLVVLSAVAVLSFGRKPAREAGPPATATATAAVPDEGLSSQREPSREDSVSVPPAANPAGVPPPSPAPSTARIPREVEPRGVGHPKAVQEVKSNPTILSVTESGLGRRIVGHQVEAQDERFTPGTVVWFQTRALGGAPGDTIRHVWIHDGRAVQSIRLRLGGPDWRTQSRKTLRHVGAWAVEARDTDGRVLARSDFTCEPPAP